MTCARAPLLPLGNAPVPAEGRPGGVPAGPEERPGAKGAGMAEGRPAPDGWRTEPALPHRGCPCPAFRRSGHGASASPGALLLRGRVNAGGDGVHSPRRAVDDPCIRPPGSAPAFALGGRSEGQSPPVRTLRNTHPSGGWPAAEGCDEDARNGLVPRARGAAARRSPPPVRPPAAFGTAGTATPCPRGGNSRSQRSHRRCWLPHWSRSSQSSLR
jgi:hypothetical protein